MHHDFWLDRWQQGRTGFHQDDINTALTRWWPALDTPANGRVLVPLCGKSRDMLWLHQQGHAVLGVELSELAVRAFFEENRLEHEQHGDRYDAQAPAAGVSLIAGDFFALETEHSGEIAAFYDRAALVALPEDMRQRYVNHLAKLLSPGTPGLLITMAYDQAVMDGPPFSVPDDEVATLFGEHFIIECLSMQDGPDTLGKFAERGLDRLEERVYHLQRRD